MKNLLMLSILIIATGCVNKKNNINMAPAVIELGSTSQNHTTWVYLSGIMQNIYAEDNFTHPILNRIGNHLNIKFLAILPKHRCPNLNNMLCWPSDNKEETLQTYQEIQNVIGSQKIEGFQFGFSNGGFFLNRLAQCIELNKPVISIGAAGPLYTKGKKNNLYLLIGKQDKFHYEHAKKFYADAKNSLLNIKLIEYDQGHVLPETLLEDLFTELHHNSVIIM